MNSTPSKCSRCGIVKPPEAFRSDPRLRRGRATRCLDCGQTVARNKYQAKNGGGAKCAVCGFTFKKIGSTHVALHGLTFAAYVQRYGNPNRDIRRTGLADRWDHLPLGEVPDSVVAEMAGTSRRAVCGVRKILGIPAFIGFTLTQEDVPTRSILEAKYDAWLHWKRVEHEHEVPVPTLPYIADFKVGDVFIEVGGMVGYKRYDTKMVRKQDDYLQWGVRVVWLTADQVNRMYQDCPVPLKFRSRTCSVCGGPARDAVKGMCRPCHRKAWGEENGTEATCIGCGESFPRSAGTPDQRFCTHGCYAKSLELDWPSWKEIDARLQEVSACQLAAELGVKPSSLYMRLRRRRERDASAPALRDTRKTLTEANVREIRRRHAAGESQTALSRAFNVGTVTIHQVVHRKTWAHVQ